MLTLLLGTDWIVNRNAVMERIAHDVKNRKPGRILIVPELISHDTERRLCQAAGDTLSRFAEVLSFSRLYARVCESVGHGVQECLDNGGRVAAMASAARQLHSKLKTYAAVETRPEFLTGFVDAVDEFKRCCISPADLLRASKETTGVLSQKLEEFSLLYEAFNALCEQGLKDPTDQMTWLLEQLEQSDFAQNHTFYIDGFPDFTRQHMAILEHLIANSHDVLISINCDEIASKNSAFEKAGSTASAIYQYARRAGYEIQVCTLPARTDSLRPVRSNLFAGKLHTTHEIRNCLHLYRTNSIHEECFAAAERIMQLTEGGARYREISVVCADMPAYRNAIQMAFARCRIPTYISGTDDILEMPVISTALAAIDAALSGFEQRDVVRYLKSLLSPLTLADADLLENYVHMWNISGSRWLTAWNYHPEGLGEEWSDRDKRKLERLNCLRSELMEPLTILRNRFLASNAVQEQVRALYAFFEQIGLCARLSSLAHQMDSAGDFRTAQILNQLWDILLTALEQLHDILGKTGWDADTFTRLLKLLLSQYDVGTIPPVLDSVTVGSVSAMRCQEEKHLIVLGALEGSLPGYSGSIGVLTEQERGALRKLGLPLTGGGMEGVQAEFAEIYGVFCGATESIDVFCPAGQPSFLYRRLAALIGSVETVNAALRAARRDKLEASALLSRWNLSATAEKWGLSEFYAQVEACKCYECGCVSRDNIRQIYGDIFNLSASQVDKQADCRLLYFLRYGLRAKECKVITVDPAEFGTYVHAVLEDTARDVMHQGGFHAVSLDDTLQIAAGHSAAYIAEHFSELDSERLKYLFKRNEQELAMVIHELWQEMQKSEFEPVDFEVGFGEHERMAAIPIQSSDWSAQLRGFVDRVDVWKQGNRSFYRVVDYKTGKKDFDYCDVYNGYGMQMLLYLFALEDAGEAVVGEHSVPAGVQYFPARAPLITADGLMDDAEAADAREKAWKRKGLLLSNEDVLSAMEPGDKPSRLPYTRRKDGTIAGDLADADQFHMLKKYVSIVLKKMVHDISSGNVEANPYTRGSSHSACAFCPYGAVCKEDKMHNIRNYKTMTAQHFWEEVEKEVKEHG